MTIGITPRVATDFPTVKSWQVKKQSLQTEEKKLEAGSNRCTAGLVPCALQLLDDMFCGCSNWFQLASIDMADHSDPISISVGKGLVSGGVNVEKLVHSVHSVVHLCQAAAKSNVGRDRETLWSCHSIAAWCGYRDWLKVKPCQGRVSPGPWTSLEFLHVTRLAAQ